MKKRSKKRSPKRSIEYQLFEIAVEGLQAHLQDRYPRKNISLNTYSSDEIIEKNKAKEKARANRKTVKKHSKSPIQKAIKSGRTL